MKRRPRLLLAAALAVGCGSDDDPAGDTATTPVPPAQLTVFRSEAVPFTFEYPKALAARKRPSGGVLAQVSIRPGSRLNALKVRRTARRELAPERYLDDFQRDFERTVGQVDQRVESIGGREVGVLEFSDTLGRGRARVEFTSASYFFKGAGGTWQLECIADERHRTRIEAACRAALESIAF